MFSMIENLITEIGDNDELTIIHNASSKLFNLPGNCNEILFYTKNRLIADYIIAPWIINKLNPDVTWFPGSALPFFIKSKTVITIFDLGYYITGHYYYRFFDTIYWKIMMRSSCIRTDKIIAISESTRKDIQKILGIDKEKIAVIYLAADTNKFQKVHRKYMDNIAIKYSLPSSFFLFTGGVSPRKNLARLFRAIEILNQKDINLVITGDTFASWSDEAEYNVIQKSNKIFRLGYVNDEELVALYNLSYAYIYPSLYEGFGLPILEAQACGCPVICSNSTSLPEVGGDSVLYFNPYDQTEIINIIKIFTHDPKIKEDLVEKGYKNIKRFSWIQAANLLLSSFREITQ